MGKNNTFIRFCPEITCSCGKKYKIKYKIDPKKQRFFKLKWAVIKWLCSFGELEIK